MGDSILSVKTSDIISCVFILGVDVIVRRHWSFGTFVLEFERSPESLKRDVRKTNERNEPVRP